MNEQKKAPKTGARVSLKEAWKLYPLRVLFVGFVLVVLIVGFVLFMAGQLGTIDILTTVGVALMLADAALVLIAYTAFMLSPATRIMRSQKAERKIALVAACKTVMSASFGLSNKTSFTIYSVVVVDADGKIYKTRTNIRPFNLEEPVKIQYLPHKPNYKRCQIVGGIVVNDKSQPNIT